MFSKEAKLVLEIAGDTDDESEAIDISLQSLVEVQVIYQNLDANDGKLHLEKSNDGVNWASAHAAIETAAGSSAANKMVSVPNVGARWVRVRWEKGSNTAGTGAVWLMAKQN